MRSIPADAIPAWGVCDVPLVALACVPAMHVACLWKGERVRACERVWACVHGGNGGGGDCEQKVLDQHLCACVVRGVR